jgi:hypothetical protein
LDGISGNHGKYFTILKKVARLNSMPKLTKFQAQLIIEKVETHIPDPLAAIAYVSLRTVIAVQCSACMTA